MTAFNDQVAFVHIPKTGGHSCREYMDSVLDGVREIDDLYPDDPSLGHVPLRDYPRFIGRPIDSWERIIAVVRNPYAQQVSQWQFWRDEFARGIRHIAREHAAMHPTMNAWLSDPMCDWHVWDIRVAGGKTKTHAKGQAGEPDAGGYEQFGGFYPYWFGVGGKIPENLCVLRFETLDETLPAALAPFHDGPAGEVPHSNTGPRGGDDPLDYLSDYARRGCIEPKFRWAFDHYYDKVSWR